MTASRFAAAARARSSPAVRQARATSRAQPGWQVVEFEDSSTTAAGSPAAAAASSAGRSPKASSTAPK